MTMRIEFTLTHTPGNIPPRTVAVSGDSLLTAIGAIVHAPGALVWNVDDEPSGSDCFSGLGTSGTDVAHTEIGSATLTESGWYSFTVTSVNGSSSTVDVVVFPADVLTVDRLRYSTRAVYSTGKPTNTIVNTPETRQIPDRRRILRSLAMTATKSGVETALEGGAAVAPYFGARPSVLCGASSDSLLPYGGTW